MKNEESEEGRRVERRAAGTATTSRRSLREATLGRRRARVHERCIEFQGKASCARVNARRRDGGVGSIQRQEGRKESEARRGREAVRGGGGTGTRRRTRGSASTTRCMDEGESEGEGVDRERAFSGRGGEGEEGPRARDERKSKQRRNTTRSDERRRRGRERGGGRLHGRRLVREGRLLAHVVQVEDAGRRARPGRCLRQDVRVDRGDCERAKKSQRAWSERRRRAEEEVERDDDDAQLAGSIPMPAASCRAVCTSSGGGAYDIWPGERAWNDWLCCMARLA